MQNTMEHTSAIERIHRQQIIDALQESAQGKQGKSLCENKTQKAAHGPGCCTENFLHRQLRGSFDHRAMQIQMNAPDRNAAKAKA